MIVPYIRLSTSHPVLRRQEWRPWKKLGYRVLDEDGFTVYHEQEAIKRTILNAFINTDADIFLFGSRATGMVHEKSDYDVGYYAEDGLSVYILAELKETLEEFPIPARVDLVDFAVLSPEFIKIAMKGGVEIWKQKRKNSFFT
ncbi:nucleotidyltransferase domain-containing protein [Pelosinus fermentans]|uniref:DNA polymerase beta domain protein region n=1 Tax=Pelosinus fermentans JBW45 TaxID=1192197 RepID=I8TW08_9FIRM|nr:nucleotidyltransferase domain-containing protein [Pelosinus fermentans]AJQ26026.1 DNA polymerase beta domain protein region [Pelosinus fermentans JBW45]